MIDFLTTGDFKYIRLFIVIILAMWFLQILAVCIDFWSGTNTAKSLGHKLYSNGFRRSFSKLGDYWRVTVMCLFIDLIGSLFTWYNMPFATLLITLAIICVEGKSVYENAKAKKSQVAKLPEMIRAIMQCANAKSAEQLIQKILEKDHETKTHQKI